PPRPPAPRRRRLWSPGRAGSGCGAPRRRIRLRTGSLKEEMQYQSTRAGLIKPSPSMAISIEARRMSAAGISVIDLSLGEPDFDTPEHILAAAAAAMRRGETRYTAADGTPELKD